MCPDQNNSIMKCPVYVVAAILISLLAFACASGRWELMRADSLSDGVPILAVYLIDKDNGWALTSGELLKLSNDGSNWTPTLSNPTSDRSFTSLAFSSQDNGVIVGSKKSGGDYSALILHTSDGGTTWQDISVDVAVVKDIHMPHSLNAISFYSRSVGWAVGDGFIVGTTDGGKTWNTQRKGNPDERLFAIGGAGPDRAWAAGPGGLLLRTTDAGKTWTRQEIDPKYNLVKVRFFGDDGWIVGEAGGHGLLLRTSDRGSTWQSQIIETSESLFDIYMNGRLGWAVGSNGTILDTVNGGQSWEKQPSPTTNDLACLFFLSPNEGWAGGAKRTLLHFRN